MLCRKIGSAIGKVQLGFAAGGPLMAKKMSQSIRNGSELPKRSSKPPPVECMSYRTIRLLCSATENCADGVREN